METMIGEQRSNLASVARRHRSMQLRGVHRRWRPARAPIVGDRAACSDG